jgi:hypothetical protein
MIPPNFREVAYSKPHRGSIRQTAPPATTSNHSPALRRTSRVRDASSRVIAFPVRDPFRHVPTHVTEAVPIPDFTTHGMCSAAAILIRPPNRADHNTAGEGAILRSSCRILPFSFRRQSIRHTVAQGSSVGERYSLRPRHAVNRFRRGRARPVRPIRISITLRIRTNRRVRAHHGLPLALRHLMFHQPETGGERYGVLSVRLAQTRYRRRSPHHEGTGRDPLQRTECGAYPIGASVRL